MRAHRDVITCAVATANGFAMPYRTRQTVQPEENDTAERTLITPLRKPALDGVRRTLARGPSETKS
jgi:hypothetical protein